MPFHGLYPRVLTPPRGGLRTTFNTLTHSHIPCTQVLSVAGLLIIRSLVPLEEEVIFRVNYLPDIPRCLTFLTVIHRYFRTCSIFTFSPFMRIRRPGTGVWTTTSRVCTVLFNINTEQCVHHGLSSHTEQEGILHTEQEGIPHTEQEQE